VDFAASDLSSSPRRIRCDGASTAQVAFLPRDAQGIPLGAGRSVTLRIAGAAGEASLGDTTDQGDGTYAAVLKAGTSLETVTVTATVGGVELDGALLVGVGFPVEEVRDDCVDSLARVLAGDPPARSVKSLKSARDLLAASPDLLAAFLKASKLLEKAVKSGAPVEADLAALAEAAREAALRGIETARPLVDSEAEGKRLARAEVNFGDGDILLGAGLRSRSISKFRGAIKLATQVQP
jgi:hypothetical protein